jgi:hypothetical protein
MVIRRKATCSCLSTPQTDRKAQTEGWLFQVIMPQTEDGRTPLEVPSPAK